MEPIHHQRIESIDVLRGFALLGLLTMNFLTFSMPMAAYFNPNAYMPESWLNFTIFSLTHVFADQKFMGIFSLLFGASTLLIIQKAEQKGQKAGRLHFARNFWLIVFGLCHTIFLWEGDVLFIYGICALFLYMFRKLPSVLLLILGGVLYLGAIPYFITASESIAQLDANSLDWLKGYWAPNQEAITKVIELHQSDYTTQLHDRLGLQEPADDAENAGQDLFMVGLLLDGFSRAFGMMLIGMAAFKTGVLTGEKSVKYYRVMCVAGLLVGLPIVLVGLYLSWSNGFNANFGLFEGRIANHFASLFMVAGYVGALHLAVLNNIAVRIQGYLASVGKLALTNYLSQSIIGSVIFYGWGLGFYGELSRLQVFVIIPVIWALQIAFSVFWLKHFRYGPFEWIWRSLCQFRFAEIRAGVKE